jgi:hypothetical protein
MTEKLQNDAYGESWAKPLLALIEYEQMKSKNSFFLLRKIFMQIITTSKIGSVANGIDNGKRRC